MRVKPETDPVAILMFLETYLALPFSPERLTGRVLNRDELFQNLPNRKFF